MAGALVDTRAERMTCSRVHVGLLFPDILRGGKFIYFAFLIGHFVPSTLRPFHLLYNAVCLGCFSSGSVGANPVILS